jgi:hypothetical protein
MRRRSDTTAKYGFELVTVRVVAWNNVRGEPAEVCNLFSIVQENVIVFQGHAVLYRPLIIAVLLAARRRITVRSLR